MNQKYPGKLLLLILLLIVNSLLLILIFSDKQAENIPRKEVCIDDTCFNAELAITPEEQEKGLMYRTIMKDNEGMLFVFSESKEYGFWMKNTFIPLDIIWIDENKKIVTIKSAIPCENKNNSCEVYYPTQNATYVLEINSGLAQQNNINVGDFVNFSI